MNTTIDEENIIEFTYKKPIKKMSWEEIEKENEYKFKTYNGNKLLKKIRIKKYSSLDS